MEAQVSIINPEHSIEEQVLEVTEDNWPVGPVARKLVRKNNIWHRASYARIIVNIYLDICQKQQKWTLNPFEIEG